MKDKFVIQGGTPLKGKVKISGSKNSAGPIISAVLLSKEPFTLSNIPLISDILHQIDILKKMGAKVEWPEKHTVKINPKTIDQKKLSDELFEKMRISVVLIGPMLARFKKCKIPHPGGDKIGLRPITTHIDAFEQLGVKVKTTNNHYIFEAPKKITKNKVILKEFSVTATENIMLFAASINKKITIDLAAAEPSIEDLIALLNKMGAKVKWIGPHKMQIKGNEKLAGTTFSICSDMLEAGTFMIAFAATRGEGEICNVDPSHLTSFLAKMKEIGVKFKIKNGCIIVKKSKKFKGATIQTMPYPGFPTDLQPQTAALLTQAEGKSLVHDPLYENRFQHLQELRKMGADIAITDPHRALILGKTKLVGTKVNTSDIRSGATLILAGLAAQGTTTVDEISHIDRGYENIESKLKKLGAKIKRV
jgi:UDP-N-acetylglucosamine 1-carboxyvinyltransferase